MCNSDLIVNLTTRPRKNKKLTIINTHVKKKKKNTKQKQNKKKNPKQQQTNKTFDRPLLENNSWKFFINKEDSQVTANWKHTP